MRCPAVAHAAFLVSCQGKQSTSVLLVSSLDGSFSKFALDLFLQLAVDVSVADARNVF